MSHRTPINCHLTHFMNLSDLESILGFVFEDKSLLQRALTHRSYLNENPSLPWLDNERLEFLGDSILGFITAEHLYQRFPEMDEGDLTSLRAALVRGQTLAEYARELDLGPQLFISRGEEAAGGRARTALLAATFEAIVGALYLDRGLEPALNLIMRVMEPKIASIVQERLDRNAKSLLQELSQGRLKVTPVYRTVSSSGPDHAREFTVHVLLGKRIFGIGHGRNKQTAEQAAAQAAIAELERQLDESTAVENPPSEAAAPVTEVIASTSGETALIVPEVKTSEPPPTDQLPTAESSGMALPEEQDGSAQVQPTETGASTAQDNSATMEPAETGTPGEQSDSTEPEPVEITTPEKPDLPPATEPTDTTISPEPANAEAAEPVVIPAVESPEFHAEAPAELLAVESPESPAEAPAGPPAVESAEFQAEAPAKTSAAVGPIESPIEVSAETPAVESTESPADAPAEQPPAQDNTSPATDSE